MHNSKETSPQLYMSGRRVYNSKIPLNVMMKLPKGKDTLIFTFCVCKHTADYRCPSAALDMGIYARADIPKATSICSRYVVTATV